MKTCLFLFPGIADVHSGALLDQLGDVLAGPIAESTLVRLEVDDRAAVPEAEWIGLPTWKVSMADGPLVVAGLGWDPPMDSVQFHVSLLSCRPDGTIEEPGWASEPEIESIIEATHRLQTPTLRFASGKMFDHGLVWERGSIDLETIEKTKAIGMHWTTVLPQGDGDSALRKWIDDSVNMLSELECNGKRLDEGRPMLNLLWPWGQGFRTSVPNLGLLRGTPALVVGRSLRLQGLTLLARYRWMSIEGKMKEFVHSVGSRISQEKQVIVVLDFFERIGADSDEAQHERLVQSICHEIILPACENKNGPDQIAMFALPRRARTEMEFDLPLGIGAVWNRERKNSNSLRFQTSVLQEATLARQPLWEAVASALGSHAGAR